MSVQTSIESKLAEQLSPQVILVENESHKHSRGENSHFKLTLVSDVFTGLRPVQRHQKVYGVLSAELEAGVHALAIHAYTPEEWQSRGEDVPASPNCLGGSKHDKP
ncbi:BolA family protein [Oceanospirillum linum]|uniref:BolA family transcriptional regulator n=1 Tax=Oceanospirillum linum TaxID=966 RepID=A0A1T1HFR3_OCELI|nr:BolA/IbaG family iron-sulfur metabolism protein [Oceanospirillum linum]OOV88655.1 BolA family transcriptional regulator [Oceanospirillum linum]SEG03972.1 transcriptional regulator, BolA protein family [Oleiphilus messinensis]SMP21114.1 transcriptional regulator, BolA protein family [Oceanospirillum linum]